MKPAAPVALLALLATCAVSAAPPQPKAEARQLRLLLQWLPQSQFAGYYVAAEKGFFARRGLDVQLLRGGPDRDAARWLREGRADFATMFLTGALTQRDQGLPVVNLAQVVNGSTLLLVAWKDRGITRVEDLQGRRVSLWEGGFRAGFLGLFSARGIRPTILPQYGSPELFLRRGADACAAMLYNEYHRLYLAGVNPEELTVFPLKAYGFGLPEDGLYCLTATLRSHPQAARDVAAACVEGWEHTAAHPDEALDLVMREARAAHVPTSRTHMKWMLDRILPTIVPEQPGAWKPGQLSPEAYRRAVELMTREGLIQSAPSFAAFCGRDVPRAD